MLKSNDMSALVLSADRLAEILLSSVRSGETSHRDVVMIATMAYQLIKATYPDTNDLFSIIQEAEATLELFAGSAGKC